VFRLWLKLHVVEAVNWVWFVVKPGEFEADKANRANEAVVAKEAVPNREPVNEVASSDPVKL
jgi:hypothetical protein